MIFVNKHLLHVVASGNCRALS